MFSFIHAADLHLDSPLRGLERLGEGADLAVVRGATRRALENLVTFALAEQVAFVVLVGDLFDGDWPDFNTGLFFNRQVARLKDAGIEVYLVHGNHDAESVISKHLRPPENLKKFSPRKAETFLIERHRVALHGQSYPERAVLKNLASSYPEARPGYYNIGLLHTSLSGREGHEPYAPCTVDSLRGRFYHYWALGHVHTREVVSQDPWIVFPGNTQGRSVRETGAKGCTLVTVQDDFTTQVRHQPLDVVRWEHLHVDLHACVTPDDALSTATQSIRDLLAQHPDHPLILRVELLGLTLAHEAIGQHREAFVASLRNAVIELAPDRLLLEKIKLKTRSQRDVLLLSPEALELSPLGPFLSAIRTLEPNHPVLAELKRELEPLRAKVGDEVFSGSESGEGELKLLLNLEKPEALRQELESFLLPRVRQAMGGAE